MRTIRRRAHLYGGLCGLVVFGIAGLGCAGAPSRTALPPAAAVPTGPQPPHATLYFRFDRRDLDARERTNADTDAAWAVPRDRTVLLVEGHADAVGGDEYNLRLGDARARSVAAALIARGVPAERIAGIVSHGERQPAVRGAGAAARARNRRVELTAW
ncbi:MAG: OmpA family protein [Deltaproteobacteria bacterium]|nr:OmpA family protein [Deltaproteobacteria bacterium]